MEDDNGTSGLEHPTSGLRMQPEEDPGWRAMKGTWVGSFPSFIHDFPHDQDPGPQLAGYDSQGGGFQQTDGYMPAAVIIGLKFSDDGMLRGRVKLNRGTKILENNEVIGSFTEGWNETLQLIEGTFQTIYPSDDGLRDIHQNYFYMLKDWNQMELFWISADIAGVPHRAHVARGSLRRVFYPNPWYHSDPIRWRETSRPQV